MMQLEKDLRTLARNHNVDASIKNPDDDGDFVCSLTGENVPLVSDVRQLMEAYGLQHEDTVETDHGWGCTCILITEDHAVKEPNTMLRTLCGAARVYAD